MKNKTLPSTIIVTIFLAALLMTPALATDSSTDVNIENDLTIVICPVENGQGNAYGAWENNWKCNIPKAFSQIENLTIDSKIIEGTPHWIFLAAGPKEKQALLEYLNTASISLEQKTRWIQFLTDMWNEHPVEFNNSTGVPILIPGNAADTFVLTSDETTTFREIELYIAGDMENDETGDIIVQWWRGYSTHEKIMEIALDDLDYSALESVAIAASGDPDTWCTNSLVPFCQQLNHGFVPFIGGLAPNNFGSLAYSAKEKFNSHDYSEAFAGMGHASHFMADLGNPYHTPSPFIIPIEYIDSPLSDIVFPNSQMILNYQKLHNEYEGMVANHWSMFYTDNQDRYDIMDPYTSATLHGSASWSMSYPLIYSSYWHYIFTGNYSFETNPTISIITKNRVTETVKNTRGLVRYVTGGQYPMLTITATAGPGGSISPSGAATVRYGEAQTFTITPNSGYIIDQVLVDGVPTTQNPYQFPMVTSDHTISATFKQNLPAIVPLCQAGTPFDATKYAQNWHQSDPMVFTCNWDGKGQVYLSGDRSSLIGTYADDGFTVDTPKGIQFDAQGHWAHMHPPLELTSGMNPGSNTFTLIVRNWAGLSMSYGSITGVGTDQVPYIIQVNSPTTTIAGENLATDDLPSFVTTTENGLMVNGSVIS